MPRRLILRSCALLAWAATAIVLAVPLLVGADSGGVLPWTQWAAASACLLALALAAPACVTQASTASGRPHLLGLLLLLLAGYGAVQAAPLPRGVLQRVAPGSSEAYSAWLSPLGRVPQDAALLQSIAPKISVDAALSRAAAWLTLLVAAAALLASHLLVERRRVEWLLIVLALTGAFHAALGIYQILTAADATVWGIRGYYGGKPFGAFINRSNATVMLNLGLAGSLGLVAWRLAALTGTPLNGQRFPLNELLDVALDRLTVAALLTASASLIGLLACGSRSGLVGLVGGLLLALGMIQSTNKLRGFIASAVALGLMAGIMMINLDLTALSANRVGTTAEQWLETAPTDEARWQHWLDASRAAVAQPLTGWGWGAYRYAYLPFQNTSGGAWFLNADNLWLELFVEAGLFGLLIVAAGLWGVIAALRQLGQSVDPIDHGLSIAGWFALGALATSQLFDFGLRIPANSLLAVILFSAVIARGFSITRPTAAATHTPSRFRFVRPLVTEPPRRSAAARYARPLTLATLIASGGLLVATTAALARQATADKAIRQARQVALDPAADFATLESAAAALHNHLQTTPDDGAAWAELSQLTWHIARIRAAIALEQTAPTASLQQRVQDLSRANLRQAWYGDRAGDDPAAPSSGEVAASPSNATDLPLGATDSRTSDSPLPLVSPAARQAREQAVASLAARPFSPEARLAILRLDFAGGDREQSSALLQQATLLRSRHTNTLLHAGDLAGESGDWSFTASCWRRAVHLNPRLVPTVLRRASRVAQLRSDDVIPDQPEALRIAAAMELKQISPDPALLSRALDSLQHQRPRVVASADELRLIARVQRQLGRLDDAALTLQQATQLHPRNPQLRWEYATALVHAGEYAEAKRQAEQGSHLTPKDPRFNKLLANIERRLKRD